MGSFKKQRVKLIMEDGSFAYCDIKIHDILDQHKNHEKLSILEEMKRKNYIITESGKVDAQLIQ
ncbi:hypothetical protein [Staphylococcus aureus]